MIIGEQLARVPFEGVGLFFGRRRNKRLIDEHIEDMYAVFIGKLLIIIEYFFAIFRLDVVQHAAGKNDVIMSVQTKIQNVRGMNNNFIFDFL